jgi:hypothetical protein
MVFVGVLAALVAGQQHHEVGHQVGQRMDAVGDQALRLGQDADGTICVEVRTTLTATLTQVLRDAATMRSAGLYSGVLGVVGKFGVFHSSRPVGHVALAMG